MTFSIGTIAIDAKGPLKAVESAIEEILQDGAEAIVGCLNVTIFPADMKQEPLTIPMSNYLCGWLEIAAAGEDAMNPITFTIPIPTELLWQGSALVAA